MARWWSNRDWPMPPTNVDLTAVDDASVSVTWDAVEYSTSYEVSWLAERNRRYPVRRIGHLATIQHDASELRPLAVTVTPEYVGKCGQDAQAEAAQAIVTPPPGCVSDALLGKVRHYYDINKHRAPGYGQNWRRPVGRQPDPIHRRRGQSPRGEVVRLEACARRTRLHRSGQSGRARKKRRSHVDLGAVAGFGVPA